MSPRLILVNGPPGIGKSTLAARYVHDHPLALNLDIDGIRTALGQWRHRNESKLIARDLATVMARAHLVSGYDVVIPQLVARIEFVEELKQLAGQAQVNFCELLLLDTKARVIERFRSRRAALDAAGETGHPQADIDPDHDADVLSQTYDALVRLSEARPKTKIVYTVAGGVDDAYEAMCRAVIR